MKVKVKKLFRGHASVRKYLVDKTIDKKEDLIVEFDGETRRFPYRSLRTHLKNNSRQKFKSKYPPYKEYELIDFPWEPKQK